MRRFSFVCLVAVLGGCRGAEAPAVTRAVVVGVAAEALPLDADWDGAVAPNPPDVYVDLNQADPPGTFAFNGPLVRTAVVENVTASQLPLRLDPNPDGAAIPLQQPVRLVVGDRDQGGLDDDDRMFTGPVFRFASRVGAAAPGDTTDLAFGDGRTRVTVTVRWEAPPAR